MDNLVISILMGANTVPQYAATCREPRIRSSVAAPAPPSRTLQKGREDDLVLCLKCSLSPVKAGLTVLEARPGRPADAQGGPARGR